MPAGSYDIYIEQGATYNLTITVRDDDDVLRDLTGYSARMHIRTTIEAPDPPMLALTTANSRIALGGVAGTVVLLIEDEDTALLTAGGPYVYDLELESAGGDVERLIEGEVTVDREVTR